MKKIFLMNLALTALLAGSFAGASIANEAGVMVGGAMMVQSKNIVENAANANNVKTLVTAVKAADLVPTLSSEGPFTVFAPTDNAFAKLPKGTVEGLLEPNNKSKLAGILTYHVVPGSLNAKDLKDGQKLKTVNGQTLNVTIKDKKVMINDAQVEIADLISSNGVTHIINSVLLPQ